MGKSRDACDAFFEGTITVFVEQGQERKARHRFAHLLQKRSNIRIEFIEVSSEEPGQLSVYHQGDVISGERVEKFLRYAEELAAV
jgi:hypothetical protein